MNKISNQSDKISPIARLKMCRRCGKTYETYFNRSIFCGKCSMRKMVMEGGVFDESDES